MTSGTAGGFSASHFHPTLTDPGDGPGFTMLGTTMRLIATAAGTEGRFTVFEQVAPVGWGPPRHIHSREEEVVYILEGTYEISLGDERRSGLREYFMAVGKYSGKCSPPPSPAQLVELARPFCLTLLPPGA